MWNTFIELILYGITSLTALFGSNTGVLILVSSLLVRFALLPLSVKLASWTLERQKEMSKLQPHLDQLKIRFKDKPEKIAQETMALYKSRGISIIDKRGLFGGFLQAPVFIGMFTAIQKLIGSGGSFMWISNIAKPDLMLALIAAGVTYFSTTLSPNTSSQGRTLMVWLPVIITMVFLWKLSAGIGIYWVASSVVSLVQSLILRHKWSSSDNAQFKIQEGVIA